VRSLRLTLVHGDWVEDDDERTVEGEHVEELEEALLKLPGGLLEVKVELLGVAKVGKQCVRVAPEEAGGGKSRDACDCFGYEESIEKAIEGIKKDGKKESEKHVTKGGWESEARKQEASVSEKFEISLPSGLQVQYECYRSQNEEMAR
jgi:hypothetical protein